MDPPVVSPREKKKRSNYSSQEDAIIVKEVNATKAYCMPKKQTELFEKVAGILERSPECKGPVSERGARDRFFYILRKFRSSDKYLRSKSGIREGFSEIDGLLADMAASMDDIEEEKQELKSITAQKKRKQKETDLLIRKLASSRAGSSRILSLRAGDEKELELKRAGLLAEQKENEAKREFERIEKEKDRNARKEELQIMLNAMIDLSKNNKNE